MKQLFIRDEPTQMFFEDSVTNNQFGEWVKNSIQLDYTNPFNLNEQHSCDVNEYDGGVYISGDEDYVELKLVVVDLINI